MLETIVSEKRPLVPPKQASQPAPLTANERLKGIFDRPRRGQTVDKEIQRKNSNVSVSSAQEKTVEDKQAALPSPPPYEKEKDLPAIEQAIEQVDEFDPGRATDLDNIKESNIAQTNDKPVDDVALTASPTEAAASSAPVAISDG